ncbi:MAG TPA: hypothetical protein VE913_16060 [Longimicrobium sp.]|nr:hypothetical protein [Longimicrobium sp.]
MADINVERKGNGPNFLPWILGLLLLGLLIWGLSQLLGRDNDEANEAVVTDSVTTVTTDTMMTSADPAMTGTTAPMAAPMDTGAMGAGAAAGTAPQMTGAVDSAGGDTVAEGATGTP